MIKRRADYNSRTCSKDVTSLKAHAHAHAKGDGEKKSTPHMMMQNSRKILQIVRKTGTHVPNVMTLTFNNGTAMTLTMPSCVIPGSLVVFVSLAWGMSFFIFGSGEDK